MKILKYFIFFSFLFVFVSCENFLQVDPKSNITTDLFYQDESDAEAGLNSIYSALKLQGLWTRGMYLNFELPTDNAVPGIGVENPDINDINFYTLNPSNNWVLFFYRDSYQLINRANSVIENVTEMEIDQNVQQQILGEARFLRAWMYYHVVRAFGDVPLPLTSTTSAVGLNLERSSEEEVYSAIIEDLVFAENNLLPFSSTEPGRANISAAKAVLADLHLTLGNWQEAIQYANEVVNSGEHRLVENFEDIYLPETTINSENIFQLIYSAGVDGGYVMTRWLPRNTFPNVSAWGADIPNPDFYEKFEDSPRRNRTFFTEHTFNGELYEFEEGPHWSKTFDPDRLGAGGGANTKPPLIRYSEILLILAEAENEFNGGPTTQAYEALNRVRARAQGDITSSDHDLPPGLNQEEFREAVLHERQLEFAFENKRWFDLKRTGKLVEKLHEAGFQNVQEFHDRRPIPQTEIDVNENLTQNPGY